MTRKPLNSIGNDLGPHQYMNHVAVVLSQLLLVGLKSLGSVGLRAVRRVRC